MASEVKLFSSNDLNLYDYPNQPHHNYYSSEWVIRDLPSFQSTNQDAMFNSTVSYAAAPEIQPNYANQGIAFTKPFTFNTDSFTEETLTNSADCMLDKKEEHQTTNIHTTNGIKALPYQPDLLFQPSAADLNASSAGIPQIYNAMENVLFETASTIIGNRVNTGADITSVHNATKANKCQVCEATAGKHNYYGGNVCTSCRGFFRRSIQSKQYPLFICIGSCAKTRFNEIPIVTEKERLALCKIDSKSRKSCKKCRFVRCINCGMRPAWVLSDEDRMKRLLQRTNKRNQLNIKKQITFHFTQEEKLLVERLKSMIYAYGYSAYYETFGEDLEIFRAYVNAIYNRQPIPYRVIKKIENIDKRAMVEKGFQLLDTVLEGSVLKINLKQTLVRHNYVSLFGFYWAVFSKACDMEEFMSEFISYGFQHRNEPGVESLLQEVSKLNLTDKKSAWDYDMIYFSPWAPCADIEQRHFKLTRRICMWPRMSADGEDKIDRSLFALLTMILLLSKDGINFETSLESKTDQKLAEESQIKFVMMLHRYLKDKYPNKDELVNTSLATGLMIVSQAKELHEMHSLMLPI